MAHWEKRAGITLEPDGVDDLETMHPVQFEIAITGIDFRRSDIIDACREVMIPAVGEKKPRPVGQVAKDYGIAQPQLSAACRAIWESWDKIQSAEGYETATLVLNQRRMKLVKLMSDDDLDELAEKLLPPDKLKQFHSKE